MEVPHSRDNAVRFFTRYILENPVAGKSVIDLSAGSGYIANAFLKAGAQVQLFDLFPEQNTFCAETCAKIDLQNDFPIATAAADIVVFAETIEHLPNQFHFFKEVARIMKPGGRLLFTTPNSSSLRSRFSQFLMESEHYSHPAPNELDAFTKWPGSTEGYFSKLFISGVLRYRTLAALQGLSIQKIHASPSSSTSVLLMIFYPLIYFFSIKNLRRQVKNDPFNKSVYEEIFYANTSLTVLLSKHLLIEFVKR